MLRTEKKYASWFLSKNEYKWIRRLRLADNKLYINYQMHIQLRTLKFISAVHINITIKSAVAYGGGTQTLILL